MIRTRPIAILRHKNLNHFSRSLLAEYIGVGTPVEIAIRLRLSKESVFLDLRKMVIHLLLRRLKSFTIRWEDSAQLHNVKVLR